MVVSSKKKKGKQRKAAVLAAAANGSGGSNKVVAKVMSGDNKVTKKLLTAEGVASLSLISYEHSGVLSIVLDYLKRCEDETFDSIMTSVGGDLKTPSTWIHILSRASYVEPSCKLQIAENIGPLISCFCNDTKRTFFKSNKCWREGIVLFVNLITNVMENGADANSLEDEKIIETMLLHDHLIRTIVQMGFWDVHRPDIMRELKAEIRITNIIAISRQFVRLLVLTDMEGESRIRLLNTIGTTPIINKEYDPSCMISYTAELVRGLKTEQGIRETKFTTLFIF